MQFRLPVRAALAALTLCIVHVFLAQDQELEGVLTVTFLDVGQGDAIFIESPTGTQVLIDGGSGGEILRALGEVMGFFDRDIDMVLATHEDTDHVGGLIEVFDHYTVDTIVMTENEGDAPAARLFRAAVATEDASVVVARTGQIYDLGNGVAGSTTLSILFPDYDPTTLETNTASIVAKLVYGESSYLFTGDAPETIETYLVSRDGALLESDVLKLGHHGSQTSTSDLFLRTVAPTLGVISAGKDNQYGHPHREVTERLNTYGIAYKNTAAVGSIMLQSDGKEIWLK
jgi:competence protein ComEC